jgi:hypothetical protein
MKKDLTMLTVQNNAIDRALRLLDAVGCKYGVVTPDGRTFGALPAQPTAPPSRPRKRRPATNFRQTGYSQKLRQMQVGDVERFFPPTGASAQQMQKTIHGTCCRLWGKGSFTTAVIKGAVEVLRMA